VPTVPRSSLREVERCLDALFQLLHQVRGELADLIGSRTTSPRLTWRPVVIKFSSLTIVSGFAAKTWLLRNGRSSFTYHLLPTIRDIAKRERMGEMKMIRRRIRPSCSFPSSSFLESILLF
jgi:hypothetical protein